MLIISIANNQQEINKLPAKNLRNSCSTLIPSQIQCLEQAQLRGFFLILLKILGVKFFGWWATSFSSTEVFQCQKIIFIATLSMIVVTTRAGSTLARFLNFIFFELKSRHTKILLIVCFFHKMYSKSLQ